MGPLIAERPPNRSERVQFGHTAPTSSVWRRSAYSATKSALTGLARAGANDLGGFGITVNCLAPGPFLTDLPTRLLTEAQQSAFAQRTVLGRWGNPEELVGPALLLASEAGSYITGATLFVDGGQMASKFGTWSDETAEFSEGRWRLR